VYAATTPNESTAEERRAVRRDQLVPDVTVELGRLAGTDHLARVTEHDLTAVVPHAVRLHVRAGRFTRGVDMREERNCGDIVVDRRRQRRRHVAVLVDRDVV
jgi:hypothetical protein